MRRKKKPKKPSYRDLEFRMVKLEAALSGANSRAGCLDDQINQDRHFTDLGRSIEYLECRMLEMRLRVVAGVKDEETKKALIAGLAVMPALLSMRLPK